MAGVQRHRRLAALHGGGHGAGFNPDLVLHIGDYHYRENACPPDIAGCQGSPWGYGWDTWQADLFRPPRRCWPRRRGWWCAATTRNARAGQGWSRFLDPRPFDATRSCDDPANDAPELRRPVRGIAGRRHAGDRVRRPRLARQR
jgi:hypothetical protein